MLATVLNRAKTQLVLQEPFYATLMFNLTIVEGETLPGGKPLWMAATDGTHLYINPINFEKLSVAKAKGVLKHELMHVALLHPWALAAREPRRWNHATDYAINPIILEEGGELPDGVLDGSSFKGQTAEQIYKQLPPNPEGGNGPIDDDVIPAQDQSQAGVEKAKIKIAQAAQVAKAMGKLPTRMKEALEDIMNPKVHWREPLRQFLTEVTPTDYSFRRPNRRFIAGDNPIYLPGVDGHDSMGSLLVVLDVSGSVSNHELAQCFGEVCGAVTDVNPKRLVVAYCDAAVLHHDVFDQPGEAQVATSFVRHGSGGTSMVAGLTWAKRNFPDVQAAIVLTDGETDWGNPDDFPFPVLWAITRNYTAPWGQTVHVEVD